MKAAEIARNVATGIFFPFCPHTLGVLKFTSFRTGKKSTVPSGTVQVRMVVPPPLPAKNHMELRCPTMQSAPVESSSGLMDVGIDSTHCHHSTLKSWRD